MPLYIGDYLGDTGHLNQGQHGAYLLFLMHYWQRGSIPTNPDDCHQIARALDDQSRSNADSVLRQYFYVTGDSYRQDRADNELARSKSAFERRSGASKRRWDKQSTSNASALNEQRISNPCDSDCIDLEPKVLEVAKLYPDIADPFHLSREHAGLIVDAIVRHGDKVLDGAKRFRECYDRWPHDAYKFLPSTRTFFSQSQYMFETTKWEKGKKKQVAMVDAMSIKRQQQLDEGMVLVDGKMQWPETK
ncbi:MAG: hypothetical protein JWQ87_5400 [Candidatus Sulfotelmatobacter sp.]|nr:hypothetical protein [Candidatus Sulfotelmatobacter sp.]